MSLIGKVGKDAAEAAAAVVSTGTTGVKTGAEMATEAIKTTGKVAKTALDTTEKATQIAAKTGIEGAEIAKDAALEGAKIASKVGTKAASEIGEQTVEAAKLINKEAGVAAASITKQSGQLAVDLTKASGEGATELTKVSFEGTKEIAKNTFQGVGDITKDSFGIIKGVFSVISGTGKFVKDSISSQIQRSREFQDINGYIQKYGIANKLVENKIKIDINRLTTATIKTLNGILFGLYKALDDSFHSYRMMILCSKDGFDLYYSNRGMGAKPKCKTVKKNNNAIISPVQDIENIIKDIKIKIENGTTVIENDIIAKYDIINKNIIGFNSRIGFIQSLSNSIFVSKKVGESDIDAYHRFYNEFAEKIEKNLNIDDLSKYFNYRADILNETMEDYIRQLTTPVIDTNKGGKRKTRKQNRRYRQTSRFNRNRKLKRQTHKRKR